MARVLVIEDNPANLDLMIYLLSAFGHTPIGAQDGEEGWDAAQREAPDIVVCDVQLPKLDGFEIARLIKSHPTLRATPLLAVTALAMVGDHDRMLAAGFDGYISKPIAPETFVAQIEAYLDPAQHSSFVPAVQETTPTEAPPPATHATILVVDDTAQNRDLLRSVLEPFGYGVVEASSVREALARARERPPDVIVSDLHMPELDGFDLIRMIRNDPVLGSTKIIIHSATVRSYEEGISTLGFGADRFITQPLEPQTLLSLLEEFLRERREHEGDGAEKETT
jgi:two-component system, cell cycle response regulator